MDIDLFVFVFVFVFALWLSWHIINAQLKTFTWPRNATTLHNTTALPGCLWLLLHLLPGCAREWESGRAGERKRATEQLGSLAGERRHFKIVKLTHRQTQAHTHRGTCRHSHTH